MKLNVGLIDADIMYRISQFPNLAVMKISAYAKSLGYNVSLIYKDDTDYTKYDILIVSRVFDFSEEQPHLKAYLDTISIDRSKLQLDVYTILNIPARPLIPLVAVGGTGYFGANCMFLHKDIEHCFPDYDIYSDYLEYLDSRGVSKTKTTDYRNCSIGFTTRGCFRRCPFCVNRRFNKCSKHSPIREFYDPSRPTITMLDDNVLAYKGWKKIFDELDEIGKPFKFKQGLDIRLLTPAIAKRLAKCRYDGDVIFAFDHINQKKLIEEKLKLWREHCQKPTKLYVLCAFDPYGHGVIRTPEDQAKADLKDISGLFERIFILMNYNCKPFVMKYKAYMDSKYRGVYIQIAGWCNQPHIFHKMTFEEYCIGQQKRSKSDKPCAAMRALELLKSDAPELYEKYAHTCKHY